MRTLDTTEIMETATRAPVERPAPKKLAKENRRTPGPDIRSYVQLFFLLLTVWIGIEFAIFVHSLESGDPAAVASHPPGVESFLPIDALMNLKYFLFSGIVNTIHPAGFFIFLAILAISTFMKKGFCSWICPVGFISEWFYKFGEKVFGRNFNPPKWLDVPLRGLKYLLLAFFLYAIGRMSVDELHAFFVTPYNKLADVKMYLFFAHASRFTLVVIAMLTVLSVFFQELLVPIPLSLRCPPGNHKPRQSAEGPPQPRLVHRLREVCKGLSIFIAGRHTRQGRFA